MPLTPATRLGAYEIVASLGVGGMGEVYRAKDLIQTRAEHAAYQIAEAHAARGEVDPAFEWLERAWAQRDPGFMGMNRSRYFRPLRSDPRWSPLVKKVGIEE